jgi:3-hydroxyisobutyrate dehydrogenase
MNRDTIGILGLGRMGGAICRRLLQAGVEVVAYNRTASRAAPFIGEGFRLVSSPKDVAERAELCLVAVTGPEDVREVVLGPVGLTAADVEGCIILDLSTIDPRSSSAISQEAARRGFRMLDAPMSGSVHAVETGTLGLMVGGDVESLEYVRVRLQAFASTIDHFGPNGSGCSAKLALNLLLAAMVQALGEAFSLLQAEAVAPDRFLKAVASSGLASPAYARAGERALTGDLNARFRLTDLCKDVTLLTNHAEGLGLNLPLARTLRGRLTAADDQYGYGDYASLITAQLDHAGQAPWRGAR